MPRFGQVLLVGEPHLAGAAAEQRLEDFAEIRVDGFEGLGEFLARNLVDFLNGLLGVADGIDQVLALRAQEIVALLRFLEFLHGGGIHRRPALRCGCALRWRPARLRRWRRHRARDRRPRPVPPPGSSVPCGWSRPGTSARPACAPARLRSASASPGSPARAARSAFSSSSPARRASRMAASCGRHLVDAGFQRGDLPASARPCRSSSILSASRRARCSPSRSISGAMALRRAGGLAELLFQAAHGGALAAVALLQSGQLGARRGVLFADGGGLRLPASPFPARSASSACFALARAAVPSPPPRRDCVSRCSADFSASRRRRSSSSRATRKARIGARQVLAQLAHFVIERHAVLLARLLQGAQPLQFGFERDDLLVQRRPGAPPARRARLWRACSRTPARALRASWPAARRRISCRRSRCGRDSRRHRAAGSRGADSSPRGAARRRGPPPGNTARRAAAGRWRGRGSRW